MIPHSSRLMEDEKDLQKYASFLFTDDQREMVAETIREVCRYRGYELSAVNVRSNHVYAVVKAAFRPEKIVEAFKGYSTRALRNAKLINSEVRVRSRHASTKYLWRECSVTAVEYVLYGQGDDFPNFEEFAD